MEACLWPQFHTILWTAIIRQEKKDIEEIEKNEKYCQKKARIVYNSLSLRVCLCSCVSVCGLILRIIVLSYNDLNIHSPRCKFEVFSWIYKERCVAKVTTVWPSNFFCIPVCLYPGYNLRFPAQRIYLHTHILNITFTTTNNNTQI